jgi:hypothetical protein
MTERHFERKRGRRMAAGRAGRNVEALENLDAINLALTGLSGPSKDVRLFEAVVSGGPTLIWNRGRRCDAA